MLFILARIYFEFDFAILFYPWKNALHWYWYYQMLAYMKSLYSMTILII